MMMYEAGPRTAPKNPNKGLEDAAPWWVWVSGSRVPGLGLGPGPPASRPDLPGPGPRRDIGLGLGFGVGSG